MKLIISESQLKKIVDIISESSSDKKYNVLFVGDSLSAGAGYTWNYLLADKHKKDWDVDHDVVGGRRVVGTKGMLESLSKKLNNKKYDLVFIWGGTNDMFSLVTEEQTKEALKRMASMVISQGGKPIIFAGYDVPSVMTKDKLKPTYYDTFDKEQNKIVKKILCDLDCVKKGRDKLISFQNSLENGIPGAYVIPRLTDPRLYAGDGSHIDGTGHQLIADYVNKELPTILQGVKKSETKSMTNTSWLSILGGLVGGIATQIYDYFFGGSGDKLTKKLISDLEELKTSSNLEFKNGFINYDQDVEPIQVALQLLGFSLDEWGVDGKFGPETKKAVEDFQIKHNFKPNGKVNQEVIKKIIDEIKSKNFKDSDFKNLNITKTEDYSDEPLQNYNIDGEFTSKLTSSTLSKFKKVLEKENIDYDDFTNKVENIGLDPNVAIQQLAMESGYFNPNVLNCNITSSKGAKGIAQFIPSTEAQYNIDACKVDQSLNAYVKLMNYNLKRFKGRVDLAVAGYNSGPFLTYNNKEVYMEALKNNTPFSELKNLVPAETWGYVNKILNI